MFLRCKDTQTSADTHEQGFGMTGALSFSSKELFASLNIDLSTSSDLLNWCSPVYYIVISSLTQNPRQTYLQLLNSVRDILRAKYSQKPQLSSSHPVDLNLMFTM